MEVDELENGLSPAAAKRGSGGVEGGRPEKRRRRSGGPEAAFEELVSAQTADRPPSLPP